MKFIKIIAKILFVFVCLFILGNGILYIYCLITPKIEINKTQSYYLYDNENNLISNNNNNWIELENISDNLIDATISTEDKKFYNHLGFDYLRMIKAIFINISNQKLSEGASTITQQYARNLFLNYEKTWSRKIEEAILAFELETHYTKDEILEGYLNTINYGGVFGIENASLFYFGKSASDLTLSEASMLAGIPQSPSNYSPLNNEKLAKERQKIVLTLMKNNDVISEIEMNDAINTNLVYYDDTKENNYSFINYFKDAVIEELNTIKTIPDSVLETGGIKIYTTLDNDAQTSLENSIKKYVTPEEQLQTAAIMMNPKNGEVMALIGGNNYNTSQFNRAVDAKRQVGSTIKPLLYYAALESGFTSDSSFISEATTFTLSNDQTYTPKNYNDTYANGAISMGAAISYSDNIYAVKTHLFLGENTLVNMCKRLGISSTIQPVPSLALGSEEISLIEMVSAYSAFANEGYSVEKHFIRKIEDKNGNVLYEYNDNKENILNSSLVYILNEMLTYTYDSALIDYNYPTVISLLPKITKKYAVKTGTTDTDSWIIGYNKNAVLGVWNGFDNNNVIGDDVNVYHKDIWVDTMESYFSTNQADWYEIPPNVVGVNVNPVTGQIDEVAENNKKMFYFIKGTDPTVKHKDTDLDTVFKENYDYIE